MPSASNAQINPRMPLNQNLATNNPPPPQAQAPNATVVHSTNMNQQQQPAISQARLSQLEAARQQNLVRSKYQSWVRFITMRTLILFIFLYNNVIVF